ncbi:O-antigen ligase family protein [Vampirovibrio sp.]|uniref:O-antigen ligase family protein n=1 Tax=Vampirovibrio sp. TaxID=2717857 RepID=UPI003593072D
MASPAIKWTDPSQQWRWAIIFLLISTVLGLMSLVIPVYVIAGLLVGAIVLSYLALNPAKTFYLAIFTIPFTERIRVLPVSFSLNELIIFYTLVVCVAHAVMKGHKVSIRTALDPWIAVLSVLFFLAGFFSISDTGLLGFFKIIEAFIVYYLAIYLLRSQQITRAAVLKTLVATAVFQALLGTFQSVTGIGAEFQSNRGYLGYLGLGSNVVWHGKGTTFHFNTLGNFLVINLLIFVPLLFRHIKRKKRAFLWFGIILLGVVTTYSRGTLLGLIAGTIFYLAVSQPNLKRALLMVGAFILCAIVPLALTLFNSSYVETVSYEERLMVWQVPMAAINSSAKAFWFGSGLNSYALAAWPHIPASVPMSQYHNWFAHNFYLLTVVEAGIVGAAILFCFLVYTWLNSWMRYARTHGGQRTYAILVSVAMVGVFFVSIFDHTFASPHYKVFIFVLLSLLYVKNTRQFRSV